MRSILEVGSEQLQVILAKNTSVVKQNTAGAAFLMLLRYFFSLSPAFLQIESSALHLNPPKCIGH